MILIGLSGKKQSGKNTAADMVEYLVTDGKDTGRTVVQLGFADALKEEICKEFQITRQFLEDNKYDWRLIMQQWGELKRKVFGGDYWVNKVAHKLIKLPDVIKCCIITDVRYKNECEFFKKASSTNSFLFRIVRSNQVGSDQHVSEVELDNYVGWHSTISNDGSKDNLMTSLREELTKHKILK